MGCPCEIRIAHNEPIAVIEKCLAEVRRFENKYSRYSPDSLVSKINRSAGISKVTIDEETKAIFDYATVCFDLSDGRFDITSGILRTVWHDQLLQLPTADEIATATHLIGWNKVVLEEHSIYLPLKGMQIDLGGVVKEYVADALVGLLRQSNVTSGLVNLGGDIAIVGPQPSGDPWEIGISNPDQPLEALAVVNLEEGAITTSGGYERFIEIEGKRYSHLLDPTTGYPVDNLLSVSVIAPQAIVAGSLSTIALLLPEQDAKAWLAESKAPFLIMDSERHLSGTIAQ